MAERRKPSSRSSSSGSRSSGGSGRSKSSGSSRSRSSGSKGKASSTQGKSSSAKSKSPGAKGKSSSSGSRASNAQSKSSKAKSKPSDAEDSRKGGANGGDSGSESDKPVRGTAPSAADIESLEKFEPSEEAKRSEPSKVDAMGQDKRREVVGHSYGPSKRRQILFFVAVAAVLFVIVGGWLALVAAFDKPPTHFTDKAPWSQTQTNPQFAAQQNATPVAPTSPCGEPGNEYPIPAASPCAPASKANGNQGANSGDPSNVAGVSNGQ